MKRYIFLLITIIFPTMSFSQELPLFDYPYEEITVQQSSPYGPGGNLEGIEQQLSIDVIPSDPRPGESFRIDVESYSTNLDAASIFWYTNGTLSRSGIGEKSEIFIAPNPGESLLVDLEIETVEGDVIARNFELSPAIVDLVYETNTYTPPFYKGKALYTYQSTATIHAIPSIVEEGVAKKGSDLIYTWEVNGSVQKDQSGYGKNTLLFNAGILSKRSNISVTVESVTSNQVATSSITLDPIDPEIVLVQEHPLYGMMGSSNGYINTTSNDVIIHAIPLFFNTNTKDTSLLNYNWTVNGRVLGEENNSSVIAFQTAPGEAGEASASVSIEHTRDLLQGATENIDILIQRTQNFLQEGLEDFSL